jgi:DNA-binding YbaB/EbfC family protein
MMPNIQKMMKQAQKMQAEMAEVQERVSAQTVEGVSGAGLVTVTVNGKGDLRGLKLDPSLLVADEVDVLEDLIIAAFSDAKAKAEAMMAAEMQKIMGGMKLPGGMSLPF